MVSDPYDFDDVLSIDEHVSEREALEARVAELEAENQALREFRPMVVVMDRNPDFSDELAVYIDNKRVDVKVITFHSEDEPGEILGRYIRVYRNEWGAPEDWHLELPDEWTADQWAAIVASEETYLPYIALATEHGLPLPEVER